MTTYQELAAALRAAADQLEPLDGQGVLPLQRSSVYLSFGYSMRPSDVEQNVVAVDAVAAALGLTAETTVTGRGANRTAEHVAKNEYGAGLNLSVRTSVPPPQTRATKLADLQRENEELRARLAANGGVRA